ncbi:MAG: hypothetical protein IK123_05460, partial [Lachnospiraceae bacterium]|nr:hypothetical protein [Lachnospiraceae bacterium]
MEDEIFIQRPEGSSQTDPDVIRNDSKEKYKKFLQGIICGLLLAMCIMGMVLIARKLYDTYMFDKAMRVASDVADGSGYRSKLVNEQVAGKIKTLEGVIDKYYLNEYTTDDLETGIYRGMIESLGDKY